LKGTGDRGNPVARFPIFFNKANFPTLNQYQAIRSNTDAFVTKLSYTLPTSSISTFSGGGLAAAGTLKKIVVMAAFLYLKIRTSEYLKKNGCFFCVFRLE